MTKESPMDGDDIFAAALSDLRDHFASHAMQAIYARGDFGGEEEVAKRAYKLADAMLKERLK